jgi:hypothetical protein
MIGAREFFPIAYPIQMKVRTKRALQFACYAILCSLAFAGDDDPPKADAPKAGAVAEAPALGAEQQRAVNLETAHPVPATVPERSSALGVVLDAASLESDASERTVAETQEHLASAEAARLRGLYQAGAGTSLKMLETAQAEESKARAEAELAAVRFAQHWGPLAKAAPAIRQQQLDAVTSGRSLLVRADLPGQHIVGAMPARAMLDVDGIEVPGRVLGALTEFSDSQSAGLLIQIDHPPPGLAAGARLPLWLYGGQRTGMLLPREAILYDENGAYVYKRAAPGAAAEKTRYSALKVTLLMRYGDGWLVHGVDDDDEIVVRGAGVLWSLEGVGARAADEEDED